MSQTCAESAPIVARTDTADEAIFARIRHLIPLRRLSDEEFVAVMHSMSVERLETGKTLFRAGIDDGFIFYLLQGTIEIVDEAGVGFTLVGGSIETAHPLSAHSSARRLATAKSPLVFVRLPIALLQIGGSVPPRVGLEVEEIGEHHNATDKRIVFDVYHALMDGSFTLPTLPDIALRIRAAAADPNNGVEEITRIVQRDPAISAYCVRMANNAAYASVSAVTEVREAVVRMGMNATSDLIMAYTLRDLYNAPDAVSRLQMQAAWRHSARIGALSFVIAKESKIINPERVLLGGLLHDIGMLIIIREWHRQAGPPLKSQPLHELGRELNASLGSMVLRNWNLPDSMVTATLEAEDWSRQMAGSLDLCGCITLAHAHDDSPPPWSLAAPELSRISALAGIADTSRTDDQKLTIIASAAEELARLDAMLAG